MAGYSIHPRTLSRWNGNAWKEEKEIGIEREREGGGSNDGRRRVDEVRLSIQGSP